MLSFVRSLHQKKCRIEHKLFLVEGEKMVNELMASDFIIHSLFADDNWEPASLFRDSQKLLQTVNAKELAQISTLQTPNKVLAVVHQPEIVFDGYLNNKHYLLLDDISDPGNVGTIIRIADWFGINEIFYSPQSVEPFNPKVVQSTMGSIFRIKIHEVDTVQLLDLNKQTVQLPVIAAVLSGKNVFEQQLTLTGILVIGNESRGINSKLQSYFTHPVCIPSFSLSAQSAESLNVAVATGILCSEIKRQQMFK